MRWVDSRIEVDEANCTAETKIRKLWFEYLVDILGIPPLEAQPRIDAEVTGQLHSSLLDGLESQGWEFENATVLDLGCGTGALASGLRSRGASVIGLEPSSEWAMATHLRFKERGVPAVEVVIADGARIPLADCSVDYVVSLQVLEHMPMPAAKQLIREVARVLCPEGRVYLAFENYCSFWEPHYRVRWFPLMPKRLGALYLEFLGRNPRFLHEHIYYNSFLMLALSCLDTGLSRPIWKTLTQKLEYPESVLGRLQRYLACILNCLPPNMRNLLVVLWAERAQLIRTRVYLEMKNG